MRNYQNIIALSRPETGRRPRMPLYERAAQFAPFAALTGFDAQIDEKARFVDRRPARSDEETERLNEALAILMESERRRFVRLIRFVPDAAKAGGVLAEEEGEVRYVDIINRRVIFSDRRAYTLDDIFSLVIL